MNAPAQDELFLLGTGTSTPAASRFGTAYVLKLGGDCIMVDCGPAATWKLVRSGLWPTQVNTLLLTHHHFDHTADLPCFLLCRWDQSTGKEQALRVFGPPSTDQFVAKLIGPTGAFADDWEARIAAPVSQSVYVNRGGALPRPLLDVDVQDLGPEVNVEGTGWRLTTARAHHVEPYLESLAYRIDTERGSIVFTGDTSPCPELDSLARGTDVLVVNCWDRQETMDRLGESPGQTGTLDAGRMACDSEAKTLVLTHTGAHLCRPGVREAAVLEVASLFKGTIVFADEGMVLPLWQV